ncbi:hypothetical protein BDQ17DRAFT_1328984 [Cyathus striatus]|nr:hypothetical protein BDQ17DRAFT_1328984 [Cyathus striatus]
MLKYLRSLISTSPAVSKPNPGARRKIANDTLARAAQVVETHSANGASLDSTFISDQLSALDPASCPNPNWEPSEVTVVNSDSFTAARNIMSDSNAIGRTVVLNLASDEAPAGGWIASMSTTQEEALCYSSTLYPTLKESYYPWPNLGPGSVAGVFSPGVVIFKHDLDHGCADLPKEEQRVASVITVAAPRLPKLTPDGEIFANESNLEDLRGKIRLVYRMAAHNGQQYLVLGAMGCGAYRCPPVLVANEMKSILLDPEFKCWFRKVEFAVYSVPRNGPGNYDVFKEVFKDVKV